MNEHIEKVCKIGQGADCCKYLLFSKVFECAKVNKNDKEVIDENWKTTKHVAQGDNCEGKENLA